MLKEPQMSVVIVSYNTRALLRKCLFNLRYVASGLDYETILVDNDSRDGSAEMVAREFPSVKLIRVGSNLGFAAANNLAFARARGRYVVLLNSDAFPQPGSLRKAIELMEANPQAGLGGARLTGTDGSWQPSARSFPSPLNDFLALSGLAAKFPKSKFFGRADRTWADPNESGEVDWVPGAFSIIRRDLLERIGYFDENYFLYYEEVDLCQRIKRAGYQVWYWPEIVVVHLGGESSKTVSRLKLSSSGTQLVLWRMRSGLLYYRRHHGALGALLALKIEDLWHRLRAWKNSVRPGDDRVAKAEESQTIVALLQQAWRETQRGAVSPARPW